MTRLDQALVSRGIARSRSRAATLVNSSQILVNGKVCTRPAQKVADEDLLQLVQEDPYVSRAAQKLIAGLDQFQVNVYGKDCLDIGSSTGGFSQVLLERRATRVVGIEVGHGQLAAELTDAPNHFNLEGFNVRDLSEQTFHEQALANLGERAAELHDFTPRVIVTDVSFISLRLVLPAVSAYALGAWDYVLLYKPQFEVGQENLASGIVKNQAAGIDALTAFVEDCPNFGLRLVAASVSPVRGTTGNIEYLLHMVPEAVWHRRKYAQKPSDSPTPLEELAAQMNAQAVPPVN